MAKNKHLTDAERLEIEHGLRHGLSLKKIAAGIGQAPLDRGTGDTRAQRRERQRRVRAGHQPLRITPLVRKDPALHGKD